ncbi:uncharacterized protein LOC100740009 isoform X2 [Bombus impatiens]|uniref:Uncharacterized protein LOC100740009 isoform X2 n=1 Tax=Bombus impatiens TaxID=132113 RepID=A0A6P8LP95_BOMIM|nr:uncharacterized protein LOC100740009 isoform X2 [Bombus impatiens]
MYSHVQRLPNRGVGLAQRCADWQERPHFTSIAAKIYDSLAPVQLREISKEGSQRRPNDANNDSAEGDLPVFEPTAANVSAFVGQTVYLPCRVRNLGDKVVSWMRSKDLHILTSGNTLFSSDTRFGPQHTPGSDAWTLRLDNARKTDSGKYECQVNTEPKMMYAVQLSVRDPDKPEGYDEPHSQQTRISYESTAPVAAIMGPREQRVPSGSTITLRCVILSPYQTRPIRGVQWLRDNKLLTFQAARGGINVETERGAARTVSELTLGGHAARRRKIFVQTNRGTNRHCNADRRTRRTYGSHAT